jgi:hypothetical protein
MALHGRLALGQPEMPPNVLRAGLQCARPSADRHERADERVRYAFANAGNIDGADIARARVERRYRPGQAHAAAAAVIEILRDRHRG